MPFDNRGLDFAVKGILGFPQTGQATQVRIHSGDPGTGNDNQISYTGLSDPGGVDVSQTAWSFGVDGTARPQNNVDFPAPPVGFTTVAASWMSLWRGNNRIGKFEIVDGSGTATTVDIVAQRIPRFTPTNLPIVVPAS